MKYRFLSQIEIDTWYPQLFKESFGYEDKAIPSLVQIAEKDGKTVGFLSGYWWYPKSVFCIRHAALMPEFRARGYAVICLLKGLQNIGCKYFLTFIENINIVAMKHALKMGFIPIGGRQDLDGKYYVEWLKKARD